MTPLAMAIVLVLSFGPVTDFTEDQFAMSKSCPDPWSAPREFVCCFSGDSVCLVDPPVEVAPR